MSSLMQKKTCLALTALVVLCCTLLAACGKAAAPGPVDDGVAAPAVADGVYLADFNTDSSMFRVNETKNGKGTLTAANGEMVIHITLQSKNILNLFPGSAEDARKDGAVLLEPTVDVVTYPDGLSEEVYGFDVPVPYLDETFSCALIGKKGTWYDHEVSVSGLEPVLADGEYTMEVSLEGGTGRAAIASPAKVRVRNGECYAEIVWSSPNYDYMIVNGERYEPISTEGNSVFEIPITPDTDLTVSADTVAMSQPHLIEYTLRFDKSTLK
jgi:hypothetical protein